MILFYAILYVHLMYGLEGSSQFCFPESPDVSRAEVEGNIRTRVVTQVATSHANLLEQKEMFT